MKDTDNHFEQVDARLQLIQKQVSGRPNLKIVADPIDTDK